MESLSWYAIKGMIAALGPKATLAVVSLYGLFYVGRAVAGFFERSQASRDAMFREMRLEVAEINRQRAEVERETFSILGTIRADIASSYAETKDTRKEMHQRFNGMTAEHTAMKESLAEIKGMKS